MKVGQKVLILDHPQATWWHRPLVGQVTTIIAVHVQESRAFGIYHLTAAAPGRNQAIAEICLKPVDDPTAFSRFMEKVRKPVDLGEPVTS